jgi:hypothetical protein
VNARRGVDVDSRLGATLGGKWLLERALGEGGMGAVYAARHVRNGKRAAIKVLHAPHARSDRTGALLGRFRREARIAALLERSGGVVEVFDDDVCDDGAPYIVMELLEGEDYDQLARTAGGTLPVADVVAMADAVLLVLSEAHRRGVVHRDLKPANVFRTREGRIKVLDFGIAALQPQADDVERPTPALTQPSTPMMGSIGFMPPEQARGEWESLDARSDLWALGATMFALLGGKTVHAATSARKELVRTMLEESAPLASVAPHAPEAVCRTVDRALAFAREKRWADATSMRASLLAECAAEIDPLAATQEARASAATLRQRDETAGGSAPAPAVDARSRARLVAALLVLAGSVAVVIVAVAVTGVGRRDVVQMPAPSQVASPGEPMPDVAPAVVVITARPVAPEIAAAAAAAASPAPAARDPDSGARRSARRRRPGGVRRGPCPTPRRRGGTCTRSERRLRAGDARAPPAAGVRHASPARRGADRRSGGLRRRRTPARRSPACRAARCSRRC